MTEILTWALTVLVIVVGVLIGTVLLVLWFEFVWWLIKLFE